MPDQPPKRASNRPGGLSTRQMLDEIERRHPGTAERVRERRERRGPLGNQIYRARMHARLTQAELAEKSGVAQSDISAYENGEGNPTWATLMKLVGAMPGSRIVAESPPAEAA